MLSGAKHLSRAGNNSAVLSRRALLAIFLLAFALRAGWGVIRLAQSGAALEFPDEQQYWLMGKSLASGGGLRDELGFRATRMPLYPALLSVFAMPPNGTYAAVAFHWVLGALAAVLTARLGQQIAGRRAGVMAGLLVAVDPFLVFFSSLLLTETPFIVALLALWLLLARMLVDEATLPRWVAAGALAAVGVYLRESSLALVIATVLFMVFCLRTRAAVLGAIGAMGIVFAALLPWATRNKLVTGSFTLLTHRGGISLYDGVRPGADGSSDLGDIKQMPAVHGLNETQWNEYFLRESLRIMRDDSPRVFRLAGTKLARTWNPVPNAQDYRSPAVRLIGAAWSVPLFAVALAGMIILWRRSPGPSLVALLLLPGIYITALHALFVGSVRYRLPASPMLAVLAAIALAALYTRLRDASQPIR